MSRGRLDVGEKGCDRMSWPPVIREVSHVLPSIGEPMIRARLSVLKRFVLTIAFERSDDTSEIMVGDTVFLRRWSRYAVSMPSVHDVARYILTKQGSMSTWKLQKLIYYSQAWHYVWEDEPLFAEPIEAWADGPVVPALFKAHKGRYTISTSTCKSGKLSNLNPAQRGSIDAVLGFYGDKTGHWLSELTHKEAPWKEAREGLAPNERGHRRITLDALGSYYARLSASVS